MSDTLSEKLHKILPSVYHEGFHRSGTSQKLSEAQGWADEVAALESKLEGYKEAMRINTDFKLMALGLEDEKIALEARLSKMEEAGQDLRASAEYVGKGRHDVGTDELNAFLEALAGESDA